MTTTRRVCGADSKNPERAKLPRDSCLQGEPYQCQLRLLLGRSPRRKKKKIAVIHLARGLKLAEMEASEWRQRAIDMEDANEREREQARQLMEFELSAAIREADRERSKLVNQLHDQDVAFAKFEAQYKKLQAEHDSQKEACHIAKQRLSYHEDQCESLQAESDKHREAVQIANQRLEQHEDRNKQLTAVLSSKESELRNAEKALEAHQIDSRRAQERERDLASAHRNLNDQCNSLQLECNMQREAAQVATQRLEQHEERHRQLAAVLSDRESELHSARIEGDARNKILEEKEKALEAHQIETRRLATIVQDKEHELASANRTLSDAMAQAQAHSAHAERLHGEFKHLQAEYQLKLEDAAKSRRQVELYSAKCENLEVALSNATTKQADHAFTREQERERADQLERVVGELRGQLGEVRGDKTRLSGSAPFSGTSTMVPSLQSFSSGDMSPKLPGHPLPPVRLTPKGSFSFSPLR